MTKTRSALIAALIITALTVATYWPVTHYGFINFDDDLYVTQNADVKNGLTWRGIVDAWKFKDTAYYHPIVWYSHMLDVQLFGLDAGMHHLTSLFIHIANAILLLAALFWMTNRFWPSVMVAAVFALHPINVDSVVWISERKNLLSTFFWLLTTIAYVHYTARPGIRRYILMLFSFMLGLLAKPMLVTLPFVFLLLDFWPLERVRFQSEPAAQRIRQLVFEKIPLFFISSFSVAVSSYSVKRIGITIPLSEVPLSLRLENAAVSYVNYAWKTLWPKGFAIYYPFPYSIPLWQALGALAILTVITGYVVIHWQRNKWQVTGWFWYLGTLVPVIGIMQSGLWPAMADRWAYVPLIGLFILIVWEASRWCARFNAHRFVMIVAVCLPVIALAAVTRLNISHWKNDRALFEHALAVTDDNAVAYTKIGAIEAIDGDLKTAIEYYRKAVAIQPYYAQFRLELGGLLEKDNQTAAAIDEYKEAIRIRPQFKEAHYYLGKLLAKTGNVNEGILHVMQALEFDPDYPDALNLAGRLLIEHGRVDEGMTYLRRALAAMPASSEIHFNIANALVLKGEPEKALAQFKEALKLAPANENALVNIGVSVIATGQIDAAIAYFERAVQIDPQFEEARRNLARAKEAKRRFEAQKVALEAAQARQGHSPELSADFGDLYLSIKNYRRATEYYTEALKERPDYSRAANNLAVAYALQGRLPEAIRYFQQVAVLNPNSEKVYYNLACVYSRNNNIQAALTSLKQAVSMGYDNWRQITGDPDLVRLRASRDYQEWLDMIKPSLTMPD